MRSISIFSAVVIFWVSHAITAQNSVEPETAGMSSERLQRLENHFQTYVDKGILPGLTTLVARKGEIVHFQQYGQMNREAGQAMQEDTIFRLYSMTKPVTGVALMMLYEEGRFKLTDPVGKYLPEYKDMQVYKGMADDGSMITEPAKRPMTIQDLMRHTSGLTYGVFGNTPVDIAYREGGLFDPSKNLEQLSKELAKFPLLYQPGERWVYSLSVDIQGRLIEVLSGKTLDVFFDDHIFKPLGMTDTSFYVPKDKHNRFVELYGIDGKGGMAPYRGDFYLPQHEKPAFLSGGGGLVSSTLDYWRFAQMLENGGEFGGVRLLSPKTIELMTIDHLPVGVKGLREDKQGFGLDFLVVKDIPSLGTAGSVGEYNWGGLANTVFWVDPEEELVAILMTNVVYQGNLPLREEMRQMVYQAIID
ncbi:serine hydrolase [Kordiimonas sp. SCSIO 12610]|uniref:serine hydrolase domain-containing protein n=1 Tax=Kordiimonas sp. SCSIO 12610 TaxID=2829597 RepID=UPI00210EE3C0|nr:serine hydrolase domain-containing protein [Kordiimonas sp. SCSIO 12610]UTW55887.1 beta-lactamase family protein [Kordiimonas sp. SCSIO 12610]